MVAVIETFSRNAIFFTKCTLGATEVDDEFVFLEVKYCTREEFTNLIRVFFHNAFFFVSTETLHDSLTSILSCNAAHLLLLKFPTNFVVEFTFRVSFTCFIEEDFTTFIYNFF